MKSIVFRSRLILRKVFTVLSVGAVSVLFQACYGMPMVPVSGTVKSGGTQEPIEGIRVSDKDDPYAFTETDEDGNFELWLVERGRSISIGDFSSVHVYALVFEDTDGPLNGSFEDAVVHWRTDDGPLNVFLVPKD